MSFAKFLNIDFGSKKLTEANDKENIASLELLASDNGIKVVSVGDNYIELESREDVENLKSIADDEEVSSYTSNRMPRRLYAGESDKSKRKEYGGSGVFAVNIIKLIDGDDAMKDVLDELIEEKGAKVKDTYTADYLDDIFSRVELKKYYKQLPALAVGRDPKSKSSSASEENEHVLEFATLYKKADGSAYDHPFDYVAEQYRDGVPICPIVRVFIRKQYVTAKEMIATFKALGKDYEDAVKQLQSCLDMSESKNMNESIDMQDLRKKEKIINKELLLLWDEYKDIKQNISKTEFNELEKIHNSISDTLADLLRKINIHLVNIEDEDEERNSELRYQGIR